MSEEKYFNDILERFSLSECNPMNTPMCTKENFSLDDGVEKIDVQLYRSLVGNLLYLANSRLDILQATSLLFRFMQGPSNHH